MTLLLAEAYLHRLDELAIHFPQGWPLPGIRWYGLSYLAGFAIGWLIVRWMARTRRSPLDTQAVADLVVAVVLGVLIGGRLGYCVFYQPSLFLFSTAFPYWGVLRITDGGMASHGGIIGVIVACVIFARRRSVPALHLLDLGAFACAPGLFLGRLANFVNGELRGDPLPASMQAGEAPWWSIKYPIDLMTGHFDPAALEAVRPQLAEAVELPQSVGLGELASAAHEAVMAGSDRVSELVAPALDAYWPSQIIQAITDGPLLMAALAIVWLRPRKPGVVGAWFLIVYAALRLLTELVRQPDEGVTTVPLPLPAPLNELARGQVLSLLMLAAGVAGLIIASRRTVQPMGGLRGPPTARRDSPEGA